MQVQFAGHSPKTKRAPGACAVEKGRAPAGLLLDIPPRPVPEGTRGGVDGDLSSQALRLNG